MSTSLQEPSRGQPEFGSIGETSGASLISGGLWTLLNRVIPQAQLLALSVIAARYLGPSGMGRQSYIAFVALALVQAATAGFPAAASRFIGERIGAQRSGEGMALYRLTRRIMSAAALLVVLVLVAVAALGGTPSAAWALAGVAGGLMVLQAVPMSLLTGAQRWREAAVPGLVTGVLTIPATAIVLAAGGGITGLFAIEAATVLVNLVWTTKLARGVARRLAPPQPAAPELRSRFLSFAGTTTLIVVVHFVVWRRSELFVLQSYSTDEQIAFYSIAFAAVSGLAKLPETIEAVTMPAVATLLGEGQYGRIRRGFWRAIRVLAFVSPSLVAGVAATGPALLRLVYGDKYDGAGPVLLVLLIPLLVQPMLTMSEALLYGLGRLRFILVAGLVATVVDIGLAFALIPSLDAVGAAIANVAAQLVAGVPCLVLAGRLHRPVALHTGALIRSIALALLVAGGALVTLAGLGDGAPGTLAAVIAGVVAFVLFGALLRPLAGDDARWLAAALGATGLRGRIGKLVLRLAPAA